MFILLMLLFLVLKKKCQVYQENMMWLFCTQTEKHLYSNEIEIFVLVLISYFCLLYIEEWHQPTMLSLEVRSKVNKLAVWS